MKPGPATSGGPWSQPAGAAASRWPTSRRAMACGGRPSPRARTSAALVERSPNLGSLGTSTAKAGASGRRSSPAAMAALSAWRTSPSTWRFIPAPAAPKAAAGMRVRDAGSGHGAACMRRRGPGQTHPGARPLLGRCAPCEPTPARLSPRAPDQPPRGSRRAQLERFRVLPPPATPPGAGSTGGGPAPPRRGRLLALGRGPTAGRLLRGGHLGLRARPLDQLDHRERRRVPVARAQLDDARVAARALGEAGRDLVEELPHHAAPPDERRGAPASVQRPRSEEHTSELQSLTNLVCRLLLEKKKKRKQRTVNNHDALIGNHPLTHHTYQIGGGYTIERLL